VTPPKSITDVFTVQNSVDFDVARDGPTRIYPPVSYVMNFTIKAHKNYTGLIREYVPASFVITPQDGLTVTTVGDTNTKILTWTKNLVKGETYNIYYAFDAPDVSPYLFTSGALEIGSFKEVRQWQIASDASVTYYFDAYDTGTPWRDNPANMIDGTETNYASTSTIGFGGTELLTGNTCLGEDLGTISKVEIRAYGYYTESSDNVILRPVFAGTTDGADYKPALTTSSATGEWGTTFDITDDAPAPSSWIWSDVTALDCDVVYYKSGQGTLAYVGKVEIIVTYYIPASWASYSDSAHENPEDTFSGDKHTVYMHGTGFLTSHLYRVAYYDAGAAPNHIETDTLNSLAGNLDSDCVFISYPGSDPGLWHAIVCDGTADPPRQPMIPTGHI